MAIIVRKYGGSSVADIPKIKQIATQIQSLHQEGHQIVVVVSAMGQTTNNLLASAREITESPDPRELDMLLSIGERKSISLVALALASIGVPTISFTGSQVGIITTNEHGNARIREIRAYRLNRALDEGKVVVIAGYQGVSHQKEITTLGRGGTDTTAVAIAAYLNADRCELMKDVDGLMQIPPSITSECHLRKEVSYSDMIEIARAGTELVALPALEIAHDFNIRLAIGNSGNGQIYTRIHRLNLDRERRFRQISLSRCSRRMIPDSPYIRQIAHLSETLIFNHDPDEPQTDTSHLLILGHQLQREHSIISALRELNPLYMDADSGRIDAFFDIQHHDTLKELIRVHISDNTGRQNT